MKKYILIAIILLIGNGAIAQPVDSVGQCNLMVGRNVCYECINEKYSVLIGDYKQGNGKDFQWSVDYSHKIFKQYPSLRGLLKSYEKNVLRKGKDCKAQRIELMRKIKIIFGIKY